MSLKEISLAELLNNTSGSEYFSVFAKLIGHSEDLILYEGVTDDDYGLIGELEDKLGYELPANYIEFLSHLNGGIFLNINLFSLADKDYNNSLYNRNFMSDIRIKLGIEEYCLIIGKHDNYVMYVDCGDDYGTYTLMDIGNNEKLEFESFSALVGFIFYVLALNENKKIEEEKIQINEMKEKLHKEITEYQKSRKKEKEKNNQKVRAKAAAKALKEMQKKEKKKNK